MGENTDETRTGATTPDLDLVTDSLSRVGGLRVPGHHPPVVVHPSRHMSLLVSSDPEGVLYRTHVSRIRRSRGRVVVN